MVSYKLSVLAPSSKQHKEMLQINFNFQQNLSLKTPKAEAP